MLKWSHYFMIILIEIYFNWIWFLPFRVTNWYTSLSGQLLLRHCKNHKHKVKNVYSSFYFTLDFFQFIFKLWISFRVSLNSSCAQWLAQSFTRRSHLRSITLKSITSSTCPPFWRWPGEETLLRGWHHVSTGWGNRNMPLKHGLPTPYLLLPTIEQVLHYELNTPEVWNHYNSNKKYFLKSIEYFKYSKATIARTFSY